MTGMTFLYLYPFFLSSFAIYFNTFISFVNAYKSWLMAAAHVKYPGENFSITYAKD
jgi:hypothetical protein